MRLPSLDTLIIVPHIPPTMPANTAADRGRARGSKKDQSVNEEPAEVEDGKAKTYYIRTVLQAKMYKNPSKAFPGGRWQYNVRWGGQESHGASWVKDYDMNKGCLRMVASFWEHVGLPSEKDETDTVKTPSEQWITKESDLYEEHRDGADDNVSTIEPMDFPRCQYLVKTKEMQAAEAAKAAAEAKAAAAAKAKAAAAARAVKAEASNA
ncbi:hypothetical protein EIP91_007785 [Steccherinum ochraceum]|uniref:Chromo domain-containing protein n=1 Tax=Steccherinum ochraceum TaxID=92696 RepID=A0A4R0R6H9_9APHY|nr:hypothetical protein EIP91_007785 [Steccherinum ochraceum]